MQGWLHALDGELGQRIQPGVLVRPRDDPRGCIRDGKVQHLAGLHEGVQGVHELLYRGRVVPPVHEKYVDVLGLVRQLGIVSC